MSSTNSSSAPPVPDLNSNVPNTQVSFLTDPKPPFNTYRAADGALYSRGVGIMGYYNGADFQDDTCLDAAPLLSKMMDALNARAERVGDSSLGIKPKKTAGRRLTMSSALPSLRAQNALKEELFQYLTGKDAPGRNLKQRKNVMMALLDELLEKKKDNDEIALKIKEVKSEIEAVLIQQAEDEVLGR